MRKKISMLSSLVLAALISMAMITPALAGISSIHWLGPVLQTYDSFYDDWVVAYETGTDWSLSVVVYGSVAESVNVSKIRVWFDWGTNYNYTYPYPLPQVPLGEYRAFTVSNTTPTTTTASNMFPHLYTAYVEYAKNTSTRELSGTFSYSWASFGYKFAVYSADQKDATDSENRYDVLVSAYSGYSWTSAQAASLIAQASLQNSGGNDYYNIGDFTKAKTSYTAAVTKFEEAIAAEDAYLASDQEARLNNTKATGTATLTNANAYMKLAEAAETEADAALVEANAAMITANATLTQADAALTNAYGWFYIGIGFALGWTLMGIGVVIYALRKPKPPT